MLDWLDAQRERGLAQKTIATRVVSVKAFSAWLADPDGGDVLAKDPLRKLKIPKVDDKPKDTLSPAEVDTLLKACDKTTLTGIRDRAILVLLYSTGLRLAEAVALQEADVDWEHGLITVRRGKGGKFRVVPLGHAAERALGRYVGHKRRPDHAPALFLANDGRPLAYRGFREIFYRLEERTGIRCNPHKWRHSSAIQYLRNGGRVEVLQQVLGHTKLDMTLHYARITGVDVATGHQVADPTRSLKTRV